MSRGDMTVLDLVELYISQKIGVKPSTRLGYKTVVNFLKNDPFGRENFICKDFRCQRVVDRAAKKWQRI